MERLQDKEEEGCGETGLPQEHSTAAYYRKCGELVSKAGKLASSHQKLV